MAGPTPDAPPADVAVSLLRRTSDIYDTPVTLDAHHVPVTGSGPWLPIDTVEADIGYVQIVVGGVDVTWLRDGVSKVLSWSDGEPFQWRAAAIRFPQITPFDTLGTGDLSMFVPLADVQLYLVSSLASDGSDSVLLWDGLLGSEEAGHDENGSFTDFHCIGLVYSADLLKAPIPFDRTTPTEVADLIAAALTDPTFRFTLATVVPTGALVVPQGSWQPRVTGLVQDLLSVAQVVNSLSPIGVYQSTVLATDGRVVYLATKDVAYTTWRITTGTKGLTVQLSRDHTQHPNAIYGEGQSADGCIWRGSVHPAAGDAFYQPIAADTKVVPAVYNPDGTVASTSPDYDADVPRIEAYEQFGRYEYNDAQASAAAEIRRDAGGAWVGRLRLRRDPEEGSRFLIKAGQNIKLQSFRGGDVLLHVVGVDVDAAQLAVDLTVDTSARDLATVGSILSRQRDVTDPARRIRPARNRSRIVDDRITGFDCESGAGYVSTSLVASTWKVLRLPFSAEGSIVGVDLQLSVADTFVVGVFDRAITTSELNATAGGDPSDPAYWDAENWDDSSGLVNAWDYDAFGYWPNAGTDTPTGKGHSDQSWEFRSQQPPYLWVALWAPVTATIAGRFFPAPLGATG
jgi:hypothetical protein